MWYAKTMPTISTIHMFLSRENPLMTIESNKIT